MAGFLVAREPPHYAMASGCKSGPSVSPGGGEASTSEPMVPLDTGQQTLTGWGDDLVLHQVVAGVSWNQHVISQT